MFEFKMRTRMIRYLWAAPLLFTIGCGDDEETKATATAAATDQQTQSGASGGWRTQQVTDTAAPPALTSFTAEAGSYLGSIVLTFSYPDYIDDYASIVFRRLRGTTMPASCDEGTVVTTLEEFTSTSYTDTGIYPGDDHSYVACIYDEAENVTLVEASTHVRANSTQRIFTTSVEFNGDLSSAYNSVTYTSAVDGANGRCETLADAAGLPNSWRALILASHNTETPPMIPYFSINYFSPITNMAGDMVAANKEDLTDGFIAASLALDESGTAVTDDDSDYGYVWTFTTSSSFNDTNDSSCLYGHSNSSSYSGRVGRASQTEYSGNWVSYTNISCDQTARLYCIEDVDAEYTAPALTLAENNTSGYFDYTIDFPADMGDVKRVETRLLYSQNFIGTYELVYASGSGTYYSGNTDNPFDDVSDTYNMGYGVTSTMVLYSYDTFNNIVGVVSGEVEAGSDPLQAFVTSGTYAGDMGGSDADTICASAASSAGLSGTFEAMLATSGEDIDTKFSSIPSSEIVQDTMGNFVMYTDYGAYNYTYIFDSIRGDENGDPIDWGEEVWTGTYSYSAASGTASTDSCSDWSNATNSNTGYYGRVGYNYGTNYYWFSYSQGDCDVARHLYCVQIAR